MAFDEERLFVTLEARVTEFERRMKAAERTGSRTYNSLKRNSASATKAMEADMARSTGRINQALASSSAQIGKIQGAFNGLRTAAVATALIGVGQAAVNAARSIAAIGDEAQRAGVSARAFQQWKFVAEQNRIPIDSMIDGLKELNLRADEFVATGAGPAAEAFERLGYTVEELQAKLVDPSALLLEIIGRLHQLDEAAQIRVADEVFGGTAGERFVELIDEGEAGIRATMERAEELGLVMEDELIAKAVVLDQQFNTLSQTVGTQLRGAIVEASTALTDFIGSFREFVRRPGIKRALGWIGIEPIEDIERRNRDTEDPRGAEARGVTTPKAPVVPHTDPTEDSRNVWDRGVHLTYADHKAIERLADPAPRGSAGGGGGGGAARGPSPDELAREVEQITRRTEAIRAGTAAQAGINPLLEDYGYSAAKAATAQELLAAAQEAGVQITPELRAQIDALAHGYAEASAEAERLDEAQADVVRSAEETAALKRDVVGGLIRGLREGKEAADLLADSLTRVADHYLELALQQMFKPTGTAAGGGFLGFLGGVLGFASGGYTGPGGKYDPAGIVHAGEYVFSKRAVDALGVGRLEAMHRAAKRGYAEGGPVAGSGAAAAPAVNAKIVNVLDPAEVVSAALATEAGERVVINFMSANSRRINAALGG